MNAIRDGEVAARIEDWRRRLIDLTYRNRLINYRATRASTIEIGQPALDELLRDPSRRLPWRFYFPPDGSGSAAGETETEAFIDDAVLAAVRAGARAPEPDEIVVANEQNPRRIIRMLENLARKSNAEYQDKALRILYVAAGFLRWRDPTRDHQELLSPLILVPAELRRASAREAYSLYFVDDEEITINASLTEKLRRDVGLAVPEEWSWEDNPLDVELTEIEAAVADRGWSVERRAVLGLFSFQKFVMYRDLLDNEVTIAQHPVVRSLAAGTALPELQAMDAEVPPLEDLDAVQPPENDLCVLDADATQRLCVEAARRGRSFVMHGPPGTGKSQTITNIISDAIGRGKRVLFVSEKAAALEVVHNRLAAQGLDEFCLLLHGERAARREVVEALHRTLTGQLVPRSSMSTHELERLGSLRELLNSTAELLHLPQTTLGDASLRDALGRLAELHAAPSVAAAPEASRARGAAVRAEFQKLDDVFQRIAERWRVSPRSFVWRDYAGERFTTDEHGRVLEKVHELAGAAHDLRQAAHGAASLIGWPRPETQRAVEQFLRLASVLEDAPPLIAAWLDEVTADEFAATVQQAHQAHLARRDAAATLRTVYPARDVRELDVAVTEAVEEKLAAAREAVGATPLWEEQFLRSISELRGVIAEAHARLPRLREAAVRAATTLGQPIQRITPDRAREIAGLAALAFRAEHRPERDWLVRAGLERAEQALADSREILTKYQAEQAWLLSEYDGSALELDVSALLRRFAEEYNTRLAIFKGSYRRDVKLMKAIRRDRQMPQDPCADLARLAALQAVGTEIDMMRDRLATAFGSYYSGRNTDTARIEAACGVAHEAVAVAAPTSDLDALASQIASGAEPNQMLAQLADQIRAEAEALDGDVDRMKPLAANVAAVEYGALPELEALFASWLQALDEAQDAVAAFERGAARPASSLSELATRLKLVAKAREADARVVEEQEAWRGVLEGAYRGDATDWPALTATAEWLRRFEEVVPDDVPRVLHEKLVSRERLWPDFAGVRQAHDRFSAAAAGVAALFTEQRRRDLLETLRQTELVDVAAFSYELAAHVDDLYDWTEYLAATRRASDAGWGGFAAALVDNEVAAERVVAAFRRAFWTRRLEALFDEDPDLQDRGATYARWIDEFRTLDTRLVRTAADRVIAATNRQRPAQVAFTGGEMDLLRREAAKKRRHMPVRLLLSELSGLLSQLKPCLMMSPLTVSSFLSPKHQFDLVVFDEASQVPPQDAINCIYRGKQIIVAGDNRQLPPTPFFQVAEVDETWTDDGEIAEDMESILDSCEALLPQHPLRWHYRSRHEDLIAFSNSHVYDDRLVTFPSADAHSMSKGVHFVFVEDGLYERGKGVNLPESRRVAERVFHHLRSSRRSVGVITFNTAQQTVITQELDRLRIEHPEYEERFAGDRLDVVFVKNLESVQGDERDVIIFSVGYGRAADGKFLMNFGPLNKEGGYRRLNVAITRARELVEVVSSVRSAEFQLSDTAGRGPRMLEQYIHYAETGGRAGSDFGAKHLEQHQRVERAIVAAVEDLGFDAVTAVGAGAFGIDIGIRDPGARDKYVLGIQTDGDAYHAISTARDRERLREAVLTNLGWRIHRIWSLDWVRNRQSEVDVLAAKLRADEVAQPAPRTQEPAAAEPEVAPRAREPVEVIDLRDAVDAGRLEWVVPYRRADLPQQSTFYEFHESVNRDRQRDLVIKLAEMEAPVHVEYAIERLAQAWGIKRRGHRVSAAGQQAIKMAVRRGMIELRGNFIWLPGQELEFVRAPGDGRHATYREIHEIAPEEIDLAISKLIEMRGGVDENLLSDVARVLGFERLGALIRDTLERRLREVVRS